MWDIIHQNDLFFIYPIKFVGEYFKLSETFMN